MIAEIFWMDTEGRTHIENYYPYINQQPYYQRTLAIRLGGACWEDNWNTHPGVLSPAMRMALIAAGVTEGLPE